MEYNEYKEMFRADIRVGGIFMRKISAFIMLIILISLVAGCGQADFANISVEFFHIEELESGNQYLVLFLEIENLTDSNLYIESPLMYEKGVRSFFLF